jgi:hypothetical protein
MKTIAQSDLKTDWSAVGWRGIMLLSGDVWLFKSGEYSYICEITVLGPQPGKSYELIVTKNGTELMRQKAKLYR